MCKVEDIEKYKKLLKNEVAKLCSSNQIHWKQPILRTIIELKDNNWPAVFFGGTLRSLLISRLVQKKPGRPRDVDIVVEGVPINALRDHFEKFISRETRFGGFQLYRKGWQFDVWPLERTWAFTQDTLIEPEFANLPQTTFFNIEAIAIDIWPRHGRRRVIYSGNDQFFTGIIDKLLEVNKEDNPFPELCVVRALLFANDLDFCLGPRLVRFIKKHGISMDVDQIEEIQMAHYGCIKRCGTSMKTWIRYIVNSAVPGSNENVRLPKTQQLKL